MRNVLYPKKWADYVAQYTGPRDRTLEIISVESVDATKAPVVVDIPLPDTLVFKRKLRGPTNQIYGSVSSQDIVQLLRDEFSIAVEKERVQVARIRELGDRVARIKKTNGQVVDVKVRIEAEM
jgi:ribosomal protein L9